MRLEIKENQIVIELSEAESNFLAQKAKQAGQEDACAYVKARLIEALELKSFDEDVIIAMTNNFNLAKVQFVSNELIMRKALSQVNDLAHDEIIPEPIPTPAIPIPAAITPIPISAAPAPTAQPDDGYPELKEDDLLSDLLDKDLLAGKGKSPKKPKEKP